MNADPAAHYLRNCGMCLLFCLVGLGKTYLLVSNILLTCMRGENWYQLWPSDISKSTFDSIKVRGWFEGNGNVVPEYAFHYQVFAMDIFRVNAWDLLWSCTRRQAAVLWIYWFSNRSWIWQGYVGSGVVPGHSRSLERLCMWTLNYVTSCAWKVLIMHVDPAIRYKVKFVMGMAQ